MYTFLELIDLKDKEGKSIEKKHKIKNKFRKRCTND